MAWYDARFVGDHRDPNYMIHFEAKSDEEAKAHADHQWQSGSWTTTAQSFELWNVETNSRVHTRERRNA